MGRLIDRISDALAWLSAWMFFATGLMILYEVVARYGFTAPTIWAEELSRLLLIWGTFLAMASLVRRRQMIRITILLGFAGPGLRKAAELFALTFIAGFCGVVIWYGWRIAGNSLARGRTTGTLLNIPNWWSEIVIPACFALLLLQCLVEIVRLLAGQASAPLDPADSVH